MNEILEYYSASIQDSEASKHSESGVAKISYANGIFISEKNALIPDFKQTMEKTFKCNLQSLDFGNRPAVAKVSFFIAIFVCQQAFPRRALPTSALLIVEGVY